MVQGHLRLTVRPAVAPRASTDCYRNSNLMSLESKPTMASAAGERRKLTFHSLDEVLAEAARLVACARYENAGPMATGAAVGPPGGNDQRLDRRRFDPGSA